MQTINLIDLRTVCIESVNSAGDVGNATGGIGRDASLFRYSSPKQASVQCTSGYVIALYILLLAYKSAHLTAVTCNAGEMWHYEL